MDCACTYPQPVLAAARDPRSRRTVDLMDQIQQKSNQGRQHQPLHPRRCRERDVRNPSLAAVEASLAQSGGSLGGGRAGGGCRPTSDANLDAGKPKLSVALGRGVQASVTYKSRMIACWKGEN